jgi:hypothetical protein
MSTKVSAASVHVSQLERDQRDQTLAPRDRLLWLALGCGAVSVLAVARLLSPDPRGFGTHLQLGLPACGFLTLTGLPCPACGLTTCFAHLVRGQLALALRANAFGVVLFACVLGSLSLAVWASARNRAFFETFARMHVERVSLGLVIVGLLHWFARVACLLLG